MICMDYKLVTKFVCSVGKQCAVKYHFIYNYVINA